MRKALVLSLVWMLLVPSSARAGGWWSFIDVNRLTVAPGESLTLEAEFLFPSIEAARRAKDGGVWFAYVIDGLDQSFVDEAMGRSDPYGWWRLGDARVVLGAGASFSGIDSNLAHAKATFEVPDLEPGSYHVMFCDSGCEHSMGDLVPTNLEVVGSAAVARLTRQIDRSRAQFLATGALARKAETKASSAIARARAMEEVDGALARRVETLEARTARTDGPSAVGLSGWWVGVLLLLGAGLWEVGLRLRAWTSTFRPNSRTS